MICSSAGDPAKARLSRYPLIIFNMRTQLMARE